MTTADNQPLGQALAENQAFLQTMFGGSSDFYTKSFTICGCRCCIAMFAGLSSPEKLCIMVLHALGQGVPGCKAGPQLVQYLAEQSCLPTEQTPITTRTQLVEALAGGMAVLLVEGSGQALAFSTQDMPGRSVTNPSGEGNMRGPQDAFTEHLRNNISQLRRQFRTGSFTAEICTANTRAKTEYAICYDTALAPADGANPQTAAGRGTNPRPAGQHLFCLVPQAGQAQPFSRGSLYRAPGHRLRPHL